MYLAAAPMLRNRSLVECQKFMTRACNDGSRGLVRGRVAGDITEAKLRQSCTKVWPGMRLTCTCAACAAMDGESWYYDGDLNQLLSRNYPNVLYTACIMCVVVARTSRGQLLVSWDRSALTGVLSVLKKKALAERLLRPHRGQSLSHLRRAVEPPPQCAFGRALSQSVFGERL